MIRNKTMDVMLALGIIAVVMGHNYQPSTFLLPAYTFQIALFFFVSGYFFSTKEGLKNKALWLKKKFINLLIPYFLFNLFFAGLSYLLISHGIDLKALPTFYNFFVTPFVTGDQYFLFLAAWFVPQLFLLHLVAQTLVIKNKKIFLVILWLISLAVSVFFIAHASAGYSNLELVLGRSAFGLVFYLLGQFLKLGGEKLNDYLVRPETFIGAYIIYVALGEFFGSFTYSLVYADFSGSAVATLLGTLMAILMVYIISSYIALGIKENSLLLKIGQNTYSIMALHLLVFFLINYALYRLGIIPKSDLSHSFFSYQVGRSWFVYVILGIGLPLLLSLTYKKIKHKIA